MSDEISTTSDINARAIAQVRSHLESARSTMAVQNELADELSNAINSGAAGDELLAIIERLRVATTGASCHLSAVAAAFDL